MNIVSRMVAIAKMLHQACQFGSIESLAVLSVTTFVGCRYAALFVRAKASPQRGRISLKDTPLSVPELYAAAFAALYFVVCFLSFATAGWADHILLLVQVVRSILTSLIVFSVALALIVVGQALIDSIPVFNLVVQITRWTWRIIKSLFDRPTMETELIVEPVDEPSEIVQPVNYVQEQLNLAQDELQNRRELIRESGLDSYEVEAIENQLKQDHLRKVRDILADDRGRE
jgi:hypothetical protein